MENMNSTYSPHSPYITQIVSLPPNSQQLSEQPKSRQPYAPGSPAVSYLDRISLDKINYNYSPNPYALNFNPNTSANLENPGALFISDVCEEISFPRPFCVHTESHDFLSAAPRYLRALAPTLSSDCDEPCVETQISCQTYDNKNNSPEFKPQLSKTWAPLTGTPTPMSSNRGPRDKTERKKLSSTNSIPQYTDSNQQRNEIKTKFPVARIKRIMQADEEVGKVAQVTPVAVSKALELFMIALVMGAADKAREKGSKKVNAQHLKMVVDGQPERFDFLAEIVGKFTEASEGGAGENNKANRKRKEESESASDEEKEKGKKKGKGRKKNNG
ncbi:hypothetical protein GcM1_229026 [Golovinomyces cichoracearum]|uniref:Transcription factor CBF/NF-Y/archaeal histone domain-containing protein n=1 Tax=Golovinomyces cichoracearum TaxID=62708 RepID=A0A420ING1_9PEZI|nr:hypothetical protein GcM1_229026 [Golovinomyces cichoracearum]